MFHLRSLCVCVSLLEEGVEGIIHSADGFVSGHFSAYLDPTFPADQCAPRHTHTAEINGDLVPNLLNVVCQTIDVLLTHNTHLK